MKQQDEHMDDLFRKAGEDYPLNTGAGDWDAVFRRLQEDPGEDDVLVAVPLVGDGGRRNRTLWLLLLLLIPAGWAGYRFLGGAPRHDAPRHGAAILRAASIPPAAVSPVQPVHSTNPRPWVRSLAMNKPSPTGSGSWNGAVSKEAATAASNNDVPSGPEVTDLTSAPGGMDLARTFRATAIRRSTAPTLPVPGAPAAKARGRFPQTERGWYLGVMVAPDLSTVRFQKLQDPGYSFGIIGGYRLSRRLTLEAGVMWSRKQFYTDGEYVNQKDVGIYSGDQLMNMSGRSNMWEFPLDLRWDVARTRSGGFYLTGGFSSYVMNTQKYNCEVRGSGGSPWYQPWTSSTFDSYLFSSLQLGGGYSQYLGKWGALRVEPYWKIPLKGIGPGNLPVTSNGISISLIHPFR